MLTLLFLTLVLANIKGDQDPQQLRLAWTGNSGQVQVVWVTFDQAKPYLRFRDLESSDYTLVRGHSYQFKQGTSNYQWIHSANMTGLQHEVEYQYFVGNYPYISQTVKIRYHNPFETMEIAIFGDWGIGPSGKVTYNYLLTFVQSGQIDGIFHVGNIAYNLQDDNGIIGDEFLEQIEPISREIPYMIAPGNHQTYQNFTQLINRFKMIENKANGGSGLFFSMDILYAHIIMINTEVYFENGDQGAAETQYNWLVEDLKNANENRDKRPWVIVMGNRPLYCSANGASCNQEAQLLREKLEDLFHQETVDIYFSGHVHYYERDNAIYKNEVVKSGSQGYDSLENAGSTVYILSGIAGSNEGKTDIPEEKPEWCKKMGNRLGWGILNVVSEDTVLWTQYDAETWREVDYFILMKSRSRPF